MAQEQLLHNALAFATASTGKLVSLGSSLHAFKLTGADTNGQFALMEATVQPHSLVIPHLHPDFDELTIVQTGEGWMRVGDRELQVVPGDYVFIPRGTPHAVWNTTDQPSKAITIFTPAGLEHYFAAMGDVYQASTPPDFAKIGALGKQYGIVPVMAWVPEISAKYGVKMS